MSRLIGFHDKATNNVSLRIKKKKREIVGSKWSGKSFSTVFERFIGFVKGWSGGEHVRLSLIARSWRRGNGEPRRF